jgi:hypothetical protein
MLPPSGVKTLLGIPLLDILMYKRDHPYYRLMGSDLGLAPIEVCPDHLLYRRAAMATSLSKRKCSLYAPFVWMIISHQHNKCKNR